MFHEEMVQRKDAARRRIEVGVAVDKLDGDAFVKQVAHRVDKDGLRFFPFQGQDDRVLALRTGTLARGPGL